MSRHLRNETCPECRKRGKDRHGDNLGVYDDGGVYCYSCGYSVAGAHFSRNAVLDRNSERAPVGVVLPEDVDYHLPDCTLSWLGKYDISDTERSSNRLLWSENRKLLIFPYFDIYGNLLAWQGRNFATEPKIGYNKLPPKWVSYGNLNDVFHIIPQQNQYDSVVLVEDIVSAIKVSRHVPAMPLFTCKIGKERAIRLSKTISGVVVWLDPDKRKESVQEAAMASRYGLTSRVIFSSHDPKEHTDEEIKEKLNV